MRRNTWLFAATAALASLCPASARAALLAYYKFDEAPGATTAAPSAGAINGTLAGTSAFVSGGIAGNAVSLTRSGNGVVNFGNNFNLATGDFTLSYWLKTNTTEADTVAVAKHFAGFENGYLAPVGPTGGGGAAGKANFTASTFTINGVTSTTTVNDDVWHNVVAVYRAGGTLSMYVDGAPAEDTKAASPMITNAIPFLVGGVGAVNTGTPESRYTGLIDELRIYDNALSAADVQFVFDHPGALPEPAGLTTLALVSAAALTRRRRRR